MALSLLALCLAVVSVSANLPEPKLCDLVSSIPFDAGQYAQTIFGILNNNDDHLITPEDLHDEYYLKELQADASYKFVRLLDGPDADKDVDVAEIKTYLQKPQTKLAVYECITIKSQSLENLCLRDQLTNYVYLVLDDLPTQNAVTKKFFRHLEDQKDQDAVITAADLAHITDAATKANLLRELSARAPQNQPIDQAAFDKFIIHEDFGPHFRVCREKELKIEETGLFDYKYDCLTDELIHFVNHHFTELDLASVFNYLDTSNDKLFTSAELQKLTGVDKKLCDHFVQILDDDDDEVIHYGEFRSLFRKSSHHRRELTKGCMGKADQADQEECFKVNVKALIQSHPVPKLVLLPDLDVTIMFEDLDKDNNGKILKGELPWSTKAKDNFEIEVDSADVGTDIDLDEFCHYTKLQHIVYGIGDAMDKDEGNDRLKIYLQEYEKMMETMLLKKNVQDLFKYYERQNDKDTVITIDDLNEPKLGMNKEQAEYLLLEMGMGDSIITYEEFEWFVKQEKLLELYKGVCEDHAAMAKTILDYVQNYMTEYDIQELFIDLDEDKTKPMELSPEDFQKDGFCQTQGEDKINALIKALDRNTLLGMKETDPLVNFLEWWLFFNTPLGSPRKEVNFHECSAGQANQAAEFQCYKQKLFDDSIYGEEI